MAWLFAEVKKLVEGEADYEVESGEASEVIRLKREMPEGFSDYKPLLHLDKKSGRVFLASRPEFLKICLEGKDRLDGDAEFTKAMEGLPQEGNGLSYISPKAVTQFWKLLRVGTKDMPPRVGQFMEKYYEMFLPKEGVAMAEVRANLEGGILAVSNTSDSHKSTLVMAAVYPLALGAGFALPMMQKARMAEMQQMAQEEAEPAEEPEAKPQPNDKTPSDQKIKVNLQQVAFAAEAYFLDRPKEKEVDYGQLVKGNFLFEIEPVAGESYKELRLKRSGGKISVKTKDGKEISHEFPAVTD
jgi:hypothetical protein